jgi:hypothetical protein
MNVQNKFIQLINCDKIQIVLAHTLHNFFTRRKTFLWNLIFSLDTFIYSVIPQSSHCKICKVFHLEGFAAWNIFLSPQLMVVPHSEITPLCVWWFVEVDMIRKAVQYFFHFPPFSQYMYIVYFKNLWPRESLKIEPNMKKYIWNTYSYYSDRKKKHQREQITNLSALRIMSASKTIYMYCEKGGKWKKYCIPGIFESYI